MSRKGRKPSILVIGSINMDLVLETSRIPQGGESLMGEKYHYLPGGKGSNQAVALSRLGAKTSFLGKIGDDTQGRKLKTGLEKEGINTSYLKVTEEGKTGLAVILLENNGQNRIIVYPGANMKLKSEDLETAFDQSYDAVLLQLEIPQEIVIESFLQAEKNKTPVILDAGPARSFPLEKIKGLEILSPNETEVKALTGIAIKNKQTVREAAEILYEKSRAEHIVIKMGKEGAALFSNNRLEFFPARPVEKVLDTTAAGDAFTAAMALSYVSNKDINKAIRFANKAGALTVTKLGAQPSLPSIEEVNKFS
ncbi:MAG: ribokinase [Halanaerobiales bacterium]